jgi:signal transduction histidine kinase/ligand-binding sensor domain-containing protein
VQDDSGILPVISVVGLTTDSEGCLWVRLQDFSVVRYCDGKFEGPSSRAPEHMAGVSTAVRTDQGAVLFAQMNAGLFESRRGSFQLLAPASAFSKSIVTALAQTPDGEIWAGTRDAGVFRLAAGVTPSATDGLLDPKVNCLAAGGNQDIWAGTDYGIVRWNGNRFTAAAVPASPGSFQALSMVRDRDANIWVGTDSRGLLRYNSGGVAQLKESEAITALFEDREGNLWVGSAGGLERIRETAFVTYSLPEGLPTDGDHPVFVDSENRMWFPPVNGGLWWMRGGDHGRVTAGGLDQDVVYSIAGGNGELWLGRRRGGLTRLRTEGGTFAARSYTQSDGLAQNSVYSVYQSRDGTVWAGTLSGGVSRLSGEKFTTYSTLDGMASNTVVSILESSDGIMWFGTPDGLSALSNGSWRTYGTKDGLPSKSIVCLLEDSKGILWVGTASGVAFGKSGQFQVPVKAPVSLREQVLGLAEDRQGWLWLSASGHVLRLRRDKLIRDELGDGDTREYGIADGLRNVEGVKRHRSVITDALGRIWFSLKRGISMVDPGRLTLGSVPAIVRLETISADNGAVAMGTSTHIPGGRRRVTFGFIGLSLSSPDRVRFRYRLDGFDHGWSEPTAAREAAYTNLPPAHYRFRVIASNPEGVWSANEAAIGFDVDPLFRQTSWFYFIVAVAGALAATALYRLRVHQVTGQLNARFDERLAERTRIAQELHDTLLQGFLSASMQVHVANDQLPADSQAKQILTRALQLMAQVTEEGRNAVRGLRSPGSASLDLEKALLRVQEDVAFRQHASEETAFRVIVNGEGRSLRPLLRDEVYRIGREAILNAFRHARAKRVDVELTYASGGFSLVVRDDGRGIDPKIVEAGREDHWGLSGMKERAERIDAQLRVASSASAGTEIELSVPGRVAFEDQSNRGFRWPRRKSKN